MKMHGVSVVTGVRLRDRRGHRGASLSYLQSFPFDRLKIDRSFVKAVDTTPNASLIVTAIIGPGTCAEARRSSEGVKTAVRREFMIRNGCDALQDYIVGRPKPIGDSEAVLNLDVVEYARRAS